MTRNILLKPISSFDSTTFEGTNFYSAFCLAVAGFLQMGKFIYDNVKGSFSSCHLTQNYVSLGKDRLFLVLPTSKTDPFC